MKAGTKTLYICGVDWQHEVGETFVTFFKTVASLKKNRPCWNSCGIVRVEMAATWVYPQDLRKVHAEDFVSPAPKKRGAK